MRLLVPTVDDALWIAETTRLYRRYEREIVHAYDLCPWAAPVRREGRLREHVVLQRDPEDVGPSLRAIDTFGVDVDLALLIYPQLGSERSVFEQFSARVRDAEVARRPLGGAPFVLAVFHPTAAPDLQEPERHIPFLRRTPDPTLQLLRSTVLDKIRGGSAQGTQFMDPRSLGVLPTQGPSLRERIARTNLATTHRVGIETLTRSLEDIARDRASTHLRLAASGG